MSTEKYVVDTEIVYIYIYTQKENLQQISSYVTCKMFVAMRKMQNVAYSGRNIYIQIQEMFNRHLYKRL